MHTCHLISSRSPVAQTGAKRRSPAPIPAISAIPASGNHQRLPTDIREQRAGHGQDGARGLCRRTRPSQRNIRKPALGPLLILLARYAERDLCAIRQRDEAAELLCGREARLDVAKGDGVYAHAERGAPLLCERLCEAGNAGLGEGVVCLPRVAVDARGAADVDDVAGGAVFDAEEGRRGADELERRRAVQRDDRVPLLVGGLWRRGRGRLGSATRGEAWVWCAGAKAGNGLTLCSTPSQV